jgi:hypothetical protein
MDSRAAVVLVLACGIAVTGCGRNKEQREAEDAARIASKAMSVASGRDVKVDVKGDTVTFTDAKGNVKIQGGKGTKLPPDFPADIPVYKQAEILHTASRDEDQFSVALQSRDAVDKVAGFYRDAMTSADWESETTLDMPNRAILVYKKGDRMLSVMISAKQDGGTVISMTAGTDD